MSWNTLLSELNRDQANEHPQDVLQWGADWFQSRLKRERAGNASLKTTGRLPGVPSLSQSEFGPLTSPFSETGPADSPFSNGTYRRATEPSGTRTSGPQFASPFGAAMAAAAPHDRSPFSEVGPAVGGVSFASPFGAPAEEHHDEPVIPSYALGRRTSVSAESLVPTTHRPFAASGGLDSTLEEDEETPQMNTSVPSFPKSEDQLARIRTAIKPNFLFRNLDEEQEADVLGAMKEIKIPAGDVIIEQGASGDYFYIVESGKLEVFKKESQAIDANKGDHPKLGKRVAACAEGSSFGELALMHNAPRAASIISLTPCTLWALDRVSFRTILLDHTSRKRRLYESFLSEVSILASLQPQERAKIADVLESRTFVEGEDVVVQGEAGEEFYLIESGTAVAIKRDGDGQESVVKHLVKGDYFGELALINRQTRAATVRAASDKLRIAALGEQAFTRLLGPVKDIMARSAGERYGFPAAR